jgi:hypothetical protein
MPICGELRGNGERCHLPAGHDGPHRSDSAGGQRERWEVMIDRAEEETLP